jgi:hypothetical protein
VATWGASGGRIGVRLSGGALALVVVVLIAGCVRTGSSGSAGPDPTASGGTPQSLASTVEDAVAAGPSRGSDAYREPSSAQADEVAAAVVGLLAGDDRPSTPDGVGIGNAVDADGRDLRVVAEDRGEDDLRGWGTYAVLSGAGTPAKLVVEVPHPRADAGTEELGPRLFAALHADALLVAGAHRSSGKGADVAHDSASAFAAVDRAIVGRGTVVIQVHGFDESQHRGRADVVLSSTTSTPDPLVVDLADALDRAGFRPCVYDGKDCDALAGTRNTEGAHARQVGATFIHLELGSDIRQKGHEQEDLIAAITSVLTP